jgi:transcriptional regulator with XRE-family HTH domain
MSGVPISTISSYETGRMIPGIHNLVALADALETSIDDYIGHEVRE